MPALVHGLQVYRMREYTIPSQAYPYPLHKSSHNYILNTIMVASTSLSNPRIIVTGHTGNGISIFASDQRVNELTPFGPQGSTFGRFHSRDSVPVDNNTFPPDISDKIPRNPPNGVVFCTTDIKPGTQTPMHRTLSLDYCAIMSGEIVLILDGGEEKTIRAGEYVVQRGANHAWANRTQEVCRIMVVMIGAGKIRREDGTEIEDGDVKK